jgi:pimeloyl-ACP methyl ester carboxylesterase
MASAAAGAELEVVKGAGHMTPVERPAELGAILRRFLARL